MASRGQPVRLNAVQILVHQEEAVGRSYRDSRRLTRDSVMNERVDGVRRGGPHPDVASHGPRMRIPKAQRSSGVLSTSDSAFKTLMRGIEPVLDVVLHIFPSKHHPWLERL